MLGDHSILDPPDSIPNSEVKRNCADGSVGSPHVRVGHRQALNIEKAPTERLGLFSYVRLYFKIRYSLRGDLFKLRLDVQVSPRSAGLPAAL